MCCTWDSAQVYKLSIHGTCQTSVGESVLNHQIEVIVLQVIPTIKHNACIKLKSSVTSQRAHMGG